MMSGEAHAPGPPFPPCRRAVAATCRIRKPPPDMLCLRHGSAQVASAACSVGLPMIRLAASLAGFILRLFVEANSACGWRKKFP